MTEADRAPDWQIWRHMPAAKLWECVALSLDIEPRAVRHDPHAWMSGGPGRPAEPRFLEDQAFKDRWFLAKRSLGSALWPVNWHQYQRGADPVVNLAKFAKWALSVGWKMPAELSRLAGDSGPPAASDALGGVEISTVTYRSGLPGKPSSWHLIEAEYRQRHNAGEQHPTKAEWARVLVDWLGHAYPSAHPTTEKTVAGKLAGVMRELAAGTRPKS